MSDREKTKEDKLKEIRAYCGNQTYNCETDPDCDCNIRRDKVAYDLCNRKAFVLEDRWSSAEVDYVYAIMRGDVPRKFPPKEAEPTANAVVAELPTIKDSGHRREFSTGAVRDMQEGKGRMDLLPWAAIIEVSKHCENGAKKYGEHNVDKGIPTSSLCDSAARHLAKYLDGWEDEDHLLAATWNLLWAVEMRVKKPEMVDTPWREEK